MNRFRSAVPAAGALAMAAFAISPPPGARAQVQAERVEDIVVVGSRRTGRAVTDSPAPVDVISAEDLADLGATDTTEALRTLVPSYNVSTQPISDEATFVRPPNLRGLAPDQMLVLLNGKRRHRAAVISFLGNGVANGSQGPDVSVFPTIALKRVEVLRDSASAQYGSDAIAGVLNFVLRDAPEGGAIEAQWGRTYEGDGAAYRLSANVGMPVGADGFANVSAEWREADPTVRSVQRADAQASIEAGNTGIRQPYSQVWGQPRVSGDHKLFVNFGLGRAYAFGNHAARRTEGGFFFRHPDGRNGVFVEPLSDADRAAGLEQLRLVGDLTANRTGNCGTKYAGWRVGDSNDMALLDQIAGDPDCWVFNERFPSGFTPQFGGDMTDAAATLGVRDTLGNGLTWDASLTWGENAIDYYIYDTINASLGPDTPSSFDVGSHIQTETTFNVDVAREFEAGGMASPLYAAAGFEWREERFQARAGQRESWDPGPLADPDGFGVGSNGFAGFSDRVAGRWRRDNIGLYLDLEGGAGAGLTLTGAARWEDFSDFGSTSNYKGGALYRVSPAVGLRGTLSTGFRAPTVAQQNVIKEGTEFDGTKLVQTGTIPSTNPVAVSKGGRPLEPEESVTFSAGVVVDRDRSSFTADYFHIDVDGRLATSQEFTLTEEEQRELAASGYAFARNISTLQYFTNDIDTRTQGIDITATVDATGAVPLMRGGTTEVVFSGNWTQTTVRNRNEVDAKRVFQLENALPKLRANLTARNRRDSWWWLARVNYFGPYTETHLDTLDLLIHAGEEFTLDLEAGYQANDRLEVVIGAENALNNYPDRNPHAYEVGAKYPESSPMGFAGGFYYARLRYTF